jgi:hypothetical protein
MMTLIAFGSVLAGLFLLAATAKELAQGALQRSLVAYRLGFPRDLDAEDAVNAFAGLSGLLLPRWQRWLVTPYVALETHATKGGIEHYVLVPERFATVVENVLQSALPSVRYEPVEAPAIDVTRGIEHLLTSNNRPLSVDPAALSVGLLATLAPLGNDETVVIQWIVAPHPPVGAIKAQLSHTNLLTGEQAPIDGEEATALKAKQAVPLLLATGRIGARNAVSDAASDARRDVARIRRVEAAWHVARAPGVHLRRRWIPKTWTAKAMATRRAPVSVWPGRLNATELAGFSGWPIGIVGLPGLRLGGCRQVPASPAIPERGTVICDSTVPGDERPLALDLQARLRHVHVLGPTGVGKSNLLASMVIDDMEAGRGVVLLDPKGDLVTSILERVPEHRKKDVIVLDPADTSQPVGLNPLQSAHGVSAEVIVENLVGMFKSLYSYSWGPRLDDVLRAALLTLAGAEGTTLCEVPLILTNPAYRRKLVGKLDDPVGLESFWGWYEGLSDAERQAAVGPVLNKVRAFTMRPTVRSIIGQSTPTLQMCDVLAEGKILLCSLASGLLGEEAAALLGALIVAELWHATTARSGMASEHRKPVMAYLDEWQHFVHLPTPMASVLAEARGLSLGMTLAHQHMDQLTPEAKHAVLANARSRVVFQLAAGDARLMAKELGTLLTADDLQGLGAYEVVAQLFAQGTTQAPATGRTRALGAPTSDPAAIRAESRSHFGVPRDEVERAIRERQSGPTAGPIGRRTRSGDAS